jgi:DNA (cytosine-5)-methyltransferase 1
MDFIDLFAGLGGFHLALKQLGHECVFASEIDDTLKELYLKNFGIVPKGDIRKVDASEIPAHDILCAGFPCQPFSKAGSQDGLDDPELGELYREILKVVRYHHPKYLILENVPNFEKHNNGKTWEHIEQLLRKEKYDVRIHKLSPHRFGIPQIRERVYIVGSREFLDSFEWPTPDGKPTLIDKYLESKPKDARELPDQVKRCLAVWQEFLDHIPKDEKIIHPLWSMEFGATYPYEETTPSRMSVKKLKQYRGSHGQPLSDVADRKSLFKLLPSHARRDQKKFPDWKIEFIRKNREFYESNKRWLDKWIPKIKEFPASLQKLEWNCQGETRVISNYIIQMRPSGVRVKRRTTAPSLVAMTATQVPIIAWENRYMTPRECMKLQSMDGPDGLKSLPKSDNKAYEALGNAINVTVAQLVAKELVGEATRSRMKDALRLVSPLAPVGQESEARLTV